MIVEKRNYLGQTVWQYQGEVIERGDTWVCLRAVFDRAESDLGFVVFRQGDVFIEWFFSDRWYNIFQVHEGDSKQIKGWYCNITRPAVLTDDRLWADDLAIDVFVNPNGSLVLLDEDEFTSLDLSDEERLAALYAVQTIRRQVAERAAPFDVVP